MSALADAIEKLVKHCLQNIDTLVVNRIRTRARHDLVIDNGAGASIILKGDQVLINGLTSGSASGNVFERIYLGADLKCWIERDPNNGNLNFHAASGKGFEYERG